MELAVKRVGPDTIEGLAIPFGGMFKGRDLDGERFTKDTEFEFELYPVRPLLYHHGLDPAMKSKAIGRQTEYELRDEGVWAQSQLDKRARYRKTIDEMIERGDLGYSSGALGAHHVKKAPDGTIEYWPWAELTLTPTPSAFDLSSVYYTKTSDFLDACEDAGVSLSVAAIKAIADHTKSDPESPPDGDSFVDAIDHLLVDGPAWIKARMDWQRAREGSYTKSGRVLSAATRERLVNHPASLRQLADDLDELLATADAGKSAKTTDAEWEQAIAEERLRFERLVAASMGVPLT